MKKFYAIMDCREESEKEFVTEPIILDNDYQASVAFADFQKNMIKNHVKINDLRMYKIGYFNFDNTITPITQCNPIEEIAVNLVQGEEDE